MMMRYVLNPQINENEKTTEQASQTADSYVNRKSSYENSLKKRMVPNEARVDITISSRKTILVLRYFVM